MKKINLPLASLGLVIASCSSTNYTYRTSNIANQSIIANQAVVDIKLDVKNKIETVSSKKNTANEAMDEAYYKAITTNNIDIVVDPIFEVTTTDKILFWGGKSIAKLTGFGAKFENSRSKIDAIKELKPIDTTDVKKFNAIYYNQTKVNKNNANSNSAKISIFDKLMGK